MQRAQSAVDFANLLNPDASDGAVASSASSLAPASAVGSESPAAAAAASAAAGDDMASVTVIRPNGPVPNGQPAEAGSELPRPYKCPLCDKAFHRLEHQTRHIRTHTGEKPHACQFPGCSKKFSRSDELTRHSRIHNNPNSRRGNKAQIAQHQLGPMYADGIMAPPPAPKSIRSAPGSALGSPSHSPPHSYQGAGLAHYSTRFAGGSPQGSPAMEMGILAKATNQLAEQGSLAPPPPPHLQHQQASHQHQPSHHSYHPHAGHSYGLGHGHHQHSLGSARHHPYSHHGSAHASKSHLLPSLSAYHMSRSHSHDDGAEDHHYAHAYRNAKRSRPNSPNSTAPSSPTFSVDSLSPTPDHTPLATPAHSPRLRPFTASYDLPPFRSLTLSQHTTPALAPLEPIPDAPFPQANAIPAPALPGNTGRPPSGTSLAEIMGRPDGTQRKLPVPQVPKVAVHDLLSGNSEGFHPSGRSSSSNSVSGGDLMDRS